ncbi:regulatory protein RecX [Microbacterium sp. ARD32]|uniref:regulatory protein RecX n=1 Tax=Microbacterium sp. ARD32 TaxID=2962577 RepID=UPI00288259BD|nr:regulatory protein RecX [Microbacterium sp. ARD32]MDT0156960.1 regulatory protein RecX [Microbacterium sp. ARD32]
MSDHGGEEHLAPVIPLFGARRDGSQPHPQHDRAADGPPRTGEEELWRPALADGPRRTFPVPAEEAANPSDGEQADAEEVVRHAEEVLVRRLRGKQLSVAEARSVLRDNDVDRDAAEQIIDEFQHRGYLDDDTLARLLVTSGVERRGQGRVALSRVLSQRGIPREIIADALAELPDDDAERALEYARGKASGMSRLEPDTALRRLLGQLARRGYGGSVAMNAARTALREAGSGPGGVRFVDSD